MARRDLRSFRLQAWCLRRDLVPTAIDLLIPEPTEVEAERPPVKRGLVYPVEVTASPSMLSADGGPLPSPPASDEVHDLQQNRRRRRSPPLGAPPPSDSATHSTDTTPRASVPSRLGPRPACHTAPAEAQLVDEATPATEPASRSDMPEWETALDVEDRLALPIPQETPPLLLDEEKAEHGGTTVETDPSDPPVETTMTDPSLVDMSILSGPQATPPSLFGGEEVHRWDVAAEADPVDSPVVLALLGQGAAVGADSPMEAQHGVGSCAALLPSQGSCSEGHKEMSPTPT